ncbi:uncharacterized protein BO80DRAFT_501383 [Aspergillus ibericus CBS 121593]|uniref:Uncharacterized protein n=1 Tax=Aspergillus ibericus CBS 121593 TaxID=1448316 RepID=A0A395H1T8_9EURO|nr:hypothetical protein BO80DRAFT_501383 [Aspergillus ibericus CBS 121593]RAL01851.1 hypothetical protein BO80DRAFT_501383 [Aspergillus ibericus CBS 121593]
MVSETRLHQGKANEPVMSVSTRANEMMQAPSLLSGNLLTSNAGSFCRAEPFPYDLLRRVLPMLVMRLHHTSCVSGSLQAGVEVLNPFFLTSSHAGDVEAQEAAYIEVIPVGRTMNWTGGRLRRHSDIHARNKKQHFRKPRPPARGPPATLFNDPGPLEERRDFDPGDQLRQSSDQRSRNRISRSCSGNPNIAAAIHEPSPASQRLDNIKRRLLEKSDWASVGVARPLKVLFPPVQALREFGRRRRITDDDRERLRSSVSRTRSIPNTKRSQDAVSDIGSIQGLDIRINGRPVGADRSRTDRSQPVSSQSMLLDREESTPAKGTAFIPETDRDNIIRRSSFDQRSWILGSSSVSLLCSSPTGKLSTLDDSIHSSQYMIDESRHKDQLGDRKEGLLQSDSNSETSPATPVRRRFTIDDQILAEQEGRFKPYNASLGTIRYGGSQQFESPFSLRGSSQGLESSHRTAHESTGTSSTLNHSGHGWLPEPRHNIQRSISRTDRTVTDFEPYAPRVHGGQSQLSTTAQQATYPMKLYGQSVILDGNQFTSHVDCHRGGQAEPSLTCRPATSGEDKDGAQATGYPVEVNPFRTDSFALSANAFKLKHTVSPRSAIYIDQARVAKDRVCLANTGNQEYSEGYPQPRFRRKY